MILIPELEIVLILVPRTGSGSLKRAVLKTYPAAMMPYRHMEADGVPFGYDRWRRIGVVRDPVDRLWSLYNFLKGFDAPHSDQGPEYRRRMVASVNRPFEDWLLHNELVFTNPYDSEGRGRFFPGYSVRHSLPENRKSQFVYLRPDLGTHIWPYRDLERLAKFLHVDLPRTNDTSAGPPPALSGAALDYLARVFEWDFGAAIGPA